MKNVMIPEELFGKIIKYHLLDQEQEADDIRKGLARELSMVTVLIDYLFTGACHAPVRSKQGESW